jgi:capsular polysaccharide biosynthesis protein
MAYVPILVAPFMSNNTIGFILSMLTALIIAFLLTMAANRIYRGAQHSKNKVEAHNI